jgi:hypothetical protein
MTEFLVLKWREHFEEMANSHPKMLDEFLTPTIKKHKNETARVTHISPENQPYPIYL